jgi:carnitine O-acetyltransferase
MYRYQRSLPQLPVPTLLETAAKYLESVKPLVADRSPGNGNGDEYAQAQQVVEDFIASPLVRELQDRLKARAKETDNWLADWWNEAAYFGVRDPNVPGVNYFYVSGSLVFTQDTH